MFKKIKLSTKLININLANKEGDLFFKNQQLGYLIIKFSQAYFIGIDCCKLLVHRRRIRFYHFWFELKLFCFFFFRVELSRLFGLF